jgi:organic hydroperoxide reductase OsmC/OhrA
MVPGERRDLPAQGASRSSPSTPIEEDKMAHYRASVLWSRDREDDFLAKRYSRRHILRFDGGLEIAGSSSPQVVPLPWSDSAAIDPEEAFVASLASCHMLWFLSIAAERGFTVERYSDEAAGIMARNGLGKMAMTEVTLRPEVAFSGTKLPTRSEIEAMHETAHEECFIANSVKTDVRVEPVPA